MSSEARQNYLRWEEYAMGIALIAAQRSKDPNTQVGACIVDDDFKILGVGYNGHPKTKFDKDNDEKNNDKIYPWNKDQKHYYVCHAERNAIAHSSGCLKGATMYTTLYPCNECAKEIIQREFKRVVYIDEKKSNWFVENEKLEAAKYMFKHSKMEEPSFIQYHDMLRNRRNAVNFTTLHSEITLSFATSN